MSDKSGVGNQVLPLPTGGGALRGIGETFAPDLFTGTGNLTVPLELPAGRNGLQPRLSLGYSSGNGNGPFGVGWRLAVAGVARRTTRGVPRYREQDTFTFAGTEELVPVAEAGEVTRFRPRTEGLFARIERDRRPGNDVWVVRERSGLVGHYGTPGRRGQDPAAVADPANPVRVFEWRLTETEDPFGNRVEYEYQRDAAQLYPRQIRYADVRRDGGTGFLVTVTFVYERRPDPFADRRAGFAVRTRLRCRRIEVHTHAGDAPVLARTFDFAYIRDPSANGASLLHRLRVAGHDGGTTQSLPPLEFGYGAFTPEQARVRPLTATGGALPPVPLGDGSIEVAGLFGNGLPDIVQLDGTARFWRNLGGGRFARPEPMPEAPAGVRLADPGVHLADLDGDGRADLIAQDRGGYFPLGFHGRWDAAGFVRSERLPAVPLDAPDTRLVDLDGDGVVDALRTGAQPGFELFFNDPAAGWQRVETRPPLPEFPGLSLSDPRVKLADMTGDGLQDLVLVEPGQVDYWPYLGHGRWGERVTMAPGPAGLPPAGADFDPRNVRFGDVDGDGADDLIYLEPRRITVWVNQGGEGWSAPVRIDGTPPAGDPDDVRLADVLGGGTSGILFSAAPGGTADPYQFLDLTDGRKPYLLDRVDNHMGSVTRIRYGPSTAFYLADAERARTTWRTPLPFPVQVVDRVEVTDGISGRRLTNEYRYHHGYWDGAERELRGFGRVEQLDTETRTAATASPPVLTRTWFHLGPVGDESAERTAADLSAEHWPGDPSTLPDRTGELLRALPAAHRADAIRALRGQVLRTEAYELDGGALANIPFTVTEAQYGVRQEDPPADPARRRVFFPHPLAQRTTHTERGPEPMTTFRFTDDYDAYGQARREITLAVPRGRDHRSAVTAAEPYLGTRTVTSFAQRDDADRYIVDRVAQTATHEVRNDGRAALLDLVDAVRAGTATLVVAGLARTYYDGAPFTGLPLGRLGDFGAPVREEQLAFTDRLLRAAYAGGPAPVPVWLTPDGPPAWTADYPSEFRAGFPELVGYAFSPGDGYLISTARRRYDFHDDAATHRGLVTARRDPMGQDTTIRYDAFALLPVEVTDPAGLSTRAQYDYRVFQPVRLTDPNGNRTAFAFTPLGLPERIAVMGKDGENAGDTPQRPGTRFVYDFTGVSDGGQPVSVRTIRRARHGSDDETVETVEYSDGAGRLVQTRTQAADELFGEPGSAGGVLPLEPGGDGDRQAFTGRVNADRSRPNVTVGGWKVYDNKGRVVEAFEPFGTTGWDFRPPGAEQLGRRIRTAYDPRGRVRRTVNPDGSEQRVVFGVPADPADPDRFTPTPWEIHTYDANDNAGRTHPSEANPYEHHWNTPAGTVLDALGRAVVSTVRHHPPRPGPGAPLPPVEVLTTRSGYDILGNLASVTDPLGRTAHRYLHDLTGRVLRTESIDGGVRRTVPDAAGNAVEQRDSRGALILHRHDRLGRPVRLWARDDDAGRVTLRQRLEYGDGGDPAQPPDERAGHRAANRLGALHRHHDEAGLLTLQAYDFKGNVLDQTRRVIADEAVLAVFPDVADPAADWRIAPFRVDWQPPEGTSLAAHAAALLEPDGYRTTTTFDALNRVRSLRYPADVEGGRREVRPLYNRAGLLQSVTVDGEVFVERVAYNARGQRMLVVLGNGLLTRYAYHPDTFRLGRLRTDRFTRSGPLAYQPAGVPLQDLAYHHDLIGNLLEITDRTPGCGVAGNPDAAGAADTGLRALIAAGDALVRRFAYDPLYRLLSATGRECQGEPTPPWADAPACGFGSAGHGTPNQDNAPAQTRVYRETYSHDAAGNLTRLRRAGTGAATVRRFGLVGGTNRLGTLASGAQTITYAYDPAGHLIGEGEARHFGWDHAGRMAVFRTQTGAAEPSVYAHYLYDAGGRRIRKLVRRQGGAISASTYLGNAFEHHRWTEPGGSAGANNQLHVLDAEQRVARLRVGPAHPDDRAPAVLYELRDHLGSGITAVDPGGAFVNREEFTPYGETSFGGYARKGYRFTGRERDEESGLDYQGARYLACWLARWTAVDPAGPADGPNPYPYCRSNPVSRIDPGGTDSEWCVLCNPFSDDVEFAPGEAVGAAWESAVDTSRAVTGAISSGTTAAGDWVSDQANAAACSLENSPVPWLAPVAKWGGVGAATITKTAGEVVGQTLAAPAHVIIGLDEGGKAIGAGAGRIYLAEDRNDSILGVLEMLKGFGQGAEAGLTAASGGAVRRPGRGGRSGGGGRGGGGGGRGGGGGGRRGGDGLGPARRGTRKHAEHAAEVRRAQMGGGWEVLAVEKNMRLPDGTIIRPDAVYVNHAERLVLIEDLFTGPVEPLRHLQKTQRAAQAEPIKELLDKGYELKIETAMWHTDHLQ